MFLAERSFLFTRPISILKSDIPVNNYTVRSNRLVIEVINIVTWIIIKA